MSSRLVVAPLREIEAAPADAGTLAATRDAPIGGQAVLEGVMMRGIASWAVAVRKPAKTSGGSKGDDESKAGARSSNGDGSKGDPDWQAIGDADSRAGDDAGLGDIEVTCFPLDSALRRHRWLRLPIVRGVIALGGSLAIGFRALGISANAQLPAEEGEQAAQHEPAVQGEWAAAPGEQAAQGEQAAPPKEIASGVWIGTIVVALAFAIGLFFLLPLGLTSLIKGQLHSSALFWIVEGLIRTAIFLAYLTLLSRIRDLRRVFEYHGAEHKTISCFEAGLPLTPQNAQRFSRLHPRCGTSFLLIVMVVSIFLFGAIGMHAWYWLVLTRILGVPLIAGISFEIVKFAGRNRRRAWVRAVMWPGLKLQLLTTREPDLSQLAVAIAALEAVLAKEDLQSLSASDLVGVEVVA